MKNVITLEAIDPIEIYGAGNKILEEFCSYFPGLKVAARGNQIILDGSPAQIEQFGNKLEELIERRKHKMNLTKFDVEDIFDGETSPESFTLNGDAVIVHGTDGKPIRARNQRQQEMVKSYFLNDLTFAVGPAGTGKTYIAIALAVRALKNREIKRIILTRPAVEAGERLGFLPGDLQNKVDPYLRPLYDGLFDLLGAETFQKLFEKQVIEVAPLAYMRGRTLDDSFIILDEAQNTTPEQMKMFLTRMGVGSKVVVTGDVTQIDLPGSTRSGLVDALKVLKDVNGIAQCYFTDKDVVRHRLVQEIVKAYERAAHPAADAENKENNKNFK